MRTTLISQQQTKDTISVTVEGADGNYAGAVTERDTRIQLVVENPVRPKTVTLNGAVLQQAASLAEWETLESGWFYKAGNPLLVKTGRLGVTQQKLIEIKY